MIVRIISSVHDYLYILFLKVFNLDPLKIALPVILLLSCPLYNQDTSFIDLEIFPSHMGFLIMSFEAYFELLQSKFLLNISTYF